MLYALGVLIFAVGLLLSIALHEIGHMVPAKKFGVKVTQYMVGFGPTLWSRKKGDTEYGVKAIPLGGYIRMIGMVPPARADGKQSRWPRRFSTAIEDFRQVSRAEVKSEFDEPRQFYRLTPGKKMIVMLGGPSMNLLIYLVLTIILLLTRSASRQQDATTKVAEVVQVRRGRERHPGAAEGCTQTNSPAALAGLKAGDQIVAVDGTKITTWKQLIVDDRAGGRQAAAPDRAARRAGTSRSRSRRCATSSTSTTRRRKTKDVGFIGIVADHALLLRVAGRPRRARRDRPPAQRRLPRARAATRRSCTRCGRRSSRASRATRRARSASWASAGSAARSPTSTSVTLKDKAVHADRPAREREPAAVPLQPAAAAAARRRPRRGRARRGRQARTGPAAGRPSGAATRRAGRARPQIFVDTAQMLPVMYAVASVLILVTLLTLYADIVKPINIG